MKGNHLFYLLFVITVFAASCKKESFSADGNVNLGFSEDTIKFDTVFTTVGSATQLFTVYNNYDQPLKIQSINLANGSASNFRLNVNGTPGKSFNNVEIRAHDSIFIFVEVTVDPNNINTPLLITDSILFVTNGHQQDLDLVAFGQDAYFHPSKKYYENIAPVFILNDEVNATSTNIVFHNDKPHVIYGYAVVDSGCTLTVDAGTKVHFHNNSGIIVLSGGHIIVNGTLADPAILQGDRLGDQFKDVPGQWDRIWFSNLTHNRLFNGVQDIGAGPSGNVFNYAIIKNGFVGIQSDSLDGSAISVLLNNCILKNFASTAFYGQGTHMEANNSVFANCGQYCTALTIGGEYQLLHCTIANSWSSTTRQTPAVLLNNYYAPDQGIQIRNLDALFGNCIIYGSLESELGLDSANTTSKFNYLFDHCLLKVDSKISTSSTYHYKNIIRSTDPSFKDPDNNNYQLNNTSIAIDAGDLSITMLNGILSTDLKGDPRPQGANPDLGSYEMR